MIKTTKPLSTKIREFQKGIRRIPYPTGWVIIYAGTSKVATRIDPFMVVVYTSINLRGVS